MTMPAAEKRMTDAQRIRPLEIIQGVITRLAQTSFVCKGWAITLVVAVLVLGTKAPWYLLLVALLPTAVFWVLDSYYVRRERLFRKLYDDVRAGGPEAKNGGFFSMDTTPYCDEVDTWPQTCWSDTTIAYLYGAIAVVTVVVSIFA